MIYNLPTYVSPLTTYTVQVLRKLEQNGEKDIKLFMVIQANKRPIGAFFPPYQNAPVLPRFVSDYVLFPWAGKNRNTHEGTT